MKYQDVWDAHKATDDFDNTLQRVYEAHTVERDGDPDDDVTPEDIALLRAHVDDMESSLDEITSDERQEEAVKLYEEMVKVDEDDGYSKLLKTFQAQTSSGDAREFKYVRDKDDCVRIVLNIPVPHDLSAELRTKLEQHVVTEAAQVSQLWFTALEVGGEEYVNPDPNAPKPDIHLYDRKNLDVTKCCKRRWDSLPETDYGTDKPSRAYCSIKEGKVVKKNPEPEPEYEEELEALDTAVVQNISSAYRETYAALADGDASDEVVIHAVIESMLEEGYIMPGPAALPEEEDEAETTG